MCPSATTRALAREGLDFPYLDEIRDLLHVRIRKLDATVLFRRDDPGLHSRVHADFHI